LEADFSQKIEEIKKNPIKSCKNQDEKITIIRLMERNVDKFIDQTRDEMVELKTKNRDQSKRIDQLENKLLMLQNSPPTLKNSKAFVIESYDEQRRSGDFRKYSQKRPARLLPLQLLFNKNSTDDVPLPPKFYGPPHNCSELSKLGYTLNGFYRSKNLFPTVVKSTTTLN